jgi:hypothetical protein
LNSIWELDYLLNFVFNLFTLKKMSEEDILSLQQRLIEYQNKCESLKEENESLKTMLLYFLLQYESTQKSPITVKPKREPERTLEPTEFNLLPDKTSIFKELFRGRDDVYAVRWENKHGRAGYSPACANEWDPKYCRKPCSKCKHKKYLPVTNTVIRDHLTGKHIVGIYPLFQDESCYFLAADFDKKNWKDDVSVFLEICRELEVPAAIERSRSGKGGHVWIFFEDAIPATMARKLGSTILTKAMEQRHQVGFDSYDRFFPNQDTLPKGGLGNLIALPLQRNSRYEGNTLFLDRNFIPYSDQLQFLSSIKRMDTGEIEKIVEKAEKSKAIFGVYDVKTDDEQDDPWMLPSLHKKDELLLEEPLPKKINITMANMLYIDTQGLTSQLINRFVCLAAFQNPEFYQAQAMRLSTFGKPRIISCAETFSRHIGLPRGCFDNLQSFLSEHDIEYELQDNRFGGVNTDFPFIGNLRPEQEKVAKKLLVYDDGVFVAPTGFGKTVIAA